MKRASVCALLASMIALTACAPFGQPVTPIQTRGIAGPATYVAPLPTAFILLKPDNPARNSAFCDVWLKVPLTTQALATSSVRQNIVETDWLVNSQNPNPSDISNCTGLINLYDWGRATTYLQNLVAAAAAAKPKQVLNTSGPGPFIVIVVPGVDTAGTTVVVDGSPITDMSTFVQTYQTRIDQITTGLGSQSAQASAPAQTAPQAQPGASTTSGTSKTTTPWYKGIGKFVEGIIEAVWPVTTPLIAVINAVVCG
jgi:hypothetical protein